MEIKGDANTIHGGIFLSSSKTVLIARLKFRALQYFFFLLVINAVWEIKKALVIVATIGNGFFSSLKF